MKDDNGPQSFIIRELAKHLSPTFASKRDLMNFSDGRKKQKWNSWNTQWENAAVVNRAANTYNCDIRRIRPICNRSNLPDEE